MNCAACSAALADDASFCPKCGAKVGAAPTMSTPAEEGAAGLRSAVARKDEPEVELWSGGYSGKAMLGHFVLVGLATVALLIVGVLTMGVLLWICIAVAAALWIWAVGVLAFRKMNIHYRLTSQRFFHQTGILTRTTNRIEVIEMDDVTYTQGLFERMFGVGTIKIRSSDLTHPELVMPGIASVQTVAEDIDKARRKEVTRRSLRVESI